MTKPVRWGVLCTANINRKVLAGARLAEGVQLQAVASRDLDRAREYAQANDIPRAHGRYEDLS